MPFQEDLELLFSTDDLLPALMTRQRSELSDELIRVDTENELSLKPGELFSKFDLQLLVRGLIDGMIALALRKRNRR